MARIGKKIMRTIKLEEGNYEVMEGDNIPGCYERRVSTAGIEMTSTGSTTQVGDRAPGQHIKSGVTYTVSDAVNFLGFGKFQVMLSIFTGICWMTDSMEMMTLGILPPALHCDFCITEYQQAFLSTVVFVGMMISSPIWGNLCDRYGRRKCLWVSNILLLFFGAMSALSISYEWLLAFRFFVGVAVGGVPQSVTLYAEFLPTKDTARCLVLMHFFWMFGSCFEVLLALFVMPTLGWKWLLLFSALPILFFVIICNWLPESVRFLAVSGQTEKAIGTLKKIAKDNKKEMIVGQLTVEDKDATERGRLKDLFRPEMRLTTILLWFIWTAGEFCAFGVILLTTEILEQAGVEISGNMNLAIPDIQAETIANHLHVNDTAMDAQGFVNGICTATGKPCQVLSTEDYVSLLWITLAEVPGTIITVFLLDYIGRKNTMTVEFLFFGAAMLVFLFKIEGRILTTALLFLARGLVCAVFQAFIVYTPEVYPTSMRAVGMGACASVSRIGAFITPYVAQVLAKSSIPLAATCYGVVSLVAALCSILLPIETKGKTMAD